MKKAPVSDWDTYIYNVLFLIFLWKSVEEIQKCLLSFSWKKPSPVLYPSSNPYWSSTCKEHSFHKATSVACTSEGIIYSVCSLRTSTNKFRIKGMMVYVKFKYLWRIVKQTNQNDVQIKLHIFLTFL